MSDVEERNRKYFGLILYAYTSIYIKLNNAASNLKQDKK